MSHKIFAAIIVVALSFFIENAGATVAPPQDPAKVSTEVLQKVEEADVLLFPARVYSRVQTNIYAESEGIVKSLPYNVGQKISAQQTVMVIQNTDPVYQYAPAKMITPVSGVISSIPVRQGTHVTKGELLATITDPSKLRIAIEVPAQDLASLQLGTEGEFASIAQAEPLKVKVLGLSPLVDPKTGTATAELAFLSPKIAIAAGMVGQVSVKTHPHETIRIAEDAIVYREGKPFVRIVIDSKIKYTPVELGAARRGNIEIKSGMQPGQVVILRASRFVSEGEAVIAEPIKKEEPKPATPVKAST